MLVEDQNTIGPDDSDLATTEDNNAIDPMGEVSELDDVEEVSTAKDYDDDDIDDMSDES